MVCRWWSMTSALVRSSGWPVSKVCSARADAATSPFFRADALPVNVWRFGQSVQCIPWGICYRVWSTQPSSVGPVVLGPWGVPACGGGCSVDERLSWCPAVHVWGSVSLPQRDHWCRAGLQLKWGLLSWLGHEKAGISELPLSQAYSCSRSPDFHFLSVPSWTWVLANEAGGVTILFQCIYNLLLLHSLYTWGWQCVGSRHEGPRYRYWYLVCDRVVRRKEEVLVGMCGLSVHRCGDGFILNPGTAPHLERAASCPLTLPLPWIVYTAQYCSGGCGRTWPCFWGGLCSVVHIALPDPGREWKVASTLSSTSFYTRLAITTDTGDPIAVPCTCQKTFPLN